MHLVQGTEHRPRTTAPLLEVQSPCLLHTASVREGTGGSARVPGDIPVPVHVGAPIAAIPREVGLLCPYALPSDHSLLSGRDVVSTESCEPLDIF